MNYIDKRAKEIGENCGISLGMKTYAPLLRSYAVLSFSKGKETTQEDVHDAWSAWQSPLNENHKSLIPFDELTEEVQALDRLYMDAIHKASV